MNYSADTCPCVLVFYTWKKKHDNKKKQHVREKTENQSSVSLPGSASHKIERILKEAGIQLYHSGENKLFRSLCTHKDSVNEF